MITPPAGGGSDRVSPEGVQLPHVPGNGKLPPGEGCYNCDHEFGDLPLSKRGKRSVAEFEDSEEDIEDLIKNAEKHYDLVKRRQKRDVYLQRKKHRHVSVIKLSFCGWNLIMSRLFNNLVGPFVT